MTCATEGIPYANKAPDHVTINGDENVIYTCHLGYKFSFESIGQCEASGEAGGSIFCSSKLSAYHGKSFDLRHAQTLSEHMLTNMMQINSHINVV